MNRMKLQHIMLFFTMALSCVSVLFAAPDTMINHQLHALNAQSEPTLNNIFKQYKHDKWQLNVNAGALTLTGAGTVRFLQSFFYSDNSCSTLLGEASVIDNGAGLPFTSGQTVTLDTNSIYKLANNKSITTSNIACMKLFLNGSNASPDGVTCQSFTDMSCSGTSCTSSQTKSLSWAASPAVCATRYMYVVNNASDDVSKCAMNASTGELSGCAQTASGFSNPVRITVNNGYAYITDVAADNITQCTVNASTGELSSCAETVSGLSFPYGITLNNQFAYFVDPGTDDVFKCAVSASTGALSGCTGAGVPTLTRPNGIAISNGYVYVTDLGASDIRKCTINASTGDLSDCGQTASGFSNPYDIALNNGYAYIVDDGTNNVSKCEVDASTGALSNCAQAASGFTTPRSIAISGGYAYIGDNSPNTITKYTINAVDGSLSASTQTGSGFSSPNGMYIY